MYTRYRKVVREWKYIENEFYAEDSPNYNLESEIYKDSLKCIKLFEFFLLKFSTPLLVLVFGRANAEI